MPVVNVPEALIVTGSVLPTLNVTVRGVSAMDTNGSPPFGTLSRAVAVMESRVAEITASPDATPVACPFALIVAMLALDEDQVTIDVTSRLIPLE